MMNRITAHTNTHESQQAPASTSKHFEPPPTTISKRSTKVNQTIPTTIKTAKAYPIIQKTIAVTPVTQAQVQVPLHNNNTSKITGQYQYSTHSSIIPLNSGRNEKELRNMTTTVGDRNGNHSINISNSSNNRNGHNIPIREGAENNEEQNNVKKKKRSRQSFTIQEKIAHVSEYYKFCQSQREELKRQHQLQQEKQQQSDVDNNYNCNKSKDLKNDESNSRIEEEQNKIINQDSSANMAAWLRFKYAEDETNIARSTFFRWYQTYGKQVKEANDGNDGNKSADDRSFDFTESTCRHRKRIRTRPFHEMESILIEILKVRNQRLYRQKKPLSTPAFIRNKANALYKDLYGEESASAFKCSNGWLSRFMDHYASVLTPP